MHVNVMTAEEVKQHNTPDHFSYVMCGECCNDKVDIICIGFDGPDSSIQLCRKCLDTLLSKTSPLSLLLITGKDTNE